MDTVIRKAISVQRQRVREHFTASACFENMAKEKYINFTTMRPNKGFYDSDQPEKSQKESDEMERELEREKKD